MYNLEESSISAIYSSDEDVFGSVEKLTTLSSSVNNNQVTTATSTTTSEFKPILSNELFSENMQSSSSGLGRRLSRNSYACVMCNCTFHKKSQLRAHVLDAHREASDDSSSNNSDETDEEQIIPKPKDVVVTVYKCPHQSCGKEFYSEGKLDKHLKKHEDKRHLCGFPSCGKQFSFRHELLDHIKDMHSPKQSVCTICNKEFKDLQSLQVHLRTIHKNENRVFRCHYDGCNKFYTNKRNLDDHIKTTHLKTKQFKCDICQRILKHKASLRRHYKNIHNQVYVDPVSTPIPSDNEFSELSLFTDVSSSKNEDAFFNTEPEFKSPDNIDSKSTSKKRSKPKSSDTASTSSESSKKKIKVGNVFLDRILGDDINKQQ
ncbi:zinc finger protein [Naegleria gruberi]|uniref:Zinc finger protein n=1 Tax=Naegleria gruberi TaxID=5762 RepID=D2VL43_NAEGR|nr:zinc finger protein [Naegleria gruberi]EFC42475.1 zinc finger protein [Naegleria gruberi]|eukprot:XP_002675219.1 zinc finger protein [Naegleria gruberi strain NEG-M]